MLVLVHEVNLCISIGWGISTRDKHIQTLRLILFHTFFQAFRLAYLGRIAAKTSTLQLTYTAYLWCIYSWFCAWQLCYLTPLFVELYENLNVTSGVSKMCYNWKTSLVEFDIGTVFVIKFASSKNSNQKYLLL